MADFTDVLEEQREANSKSAGILMGQVDLKNIMQQQLDTMKNVFSNITTSLSPKSIQPVPPEPDEPDKPDKSESLFKKIASDLGNLFSKKKEAPSSKEEEGKETKSLFKTIGKGLSGISGKLGGIFKQGKEAASKVGSGLGAIVKGTLFGALFFGLAKFLQSETFATMLDKLLTVILPKINKFLADLGAFIADPSFGNIGKLIGENKAVLATLSVIILGIGKTIKLITLPFRLIFKTFKAIGKSIEFIKKVDFKSIGKNLKAVGKFLKTFGRLFARILPIGTVVISLFSGIKDAISVFKETGSFLEAFKEGIASTIANIIGFPLNVLKSVVGFVAGLFGFDDFKEKLAEFDFIKIIKDSIHKVFDFFEDIFGKIIEFVKNLNPVEMVKNVGKFALGLFGDKEDEEEPQSQNQRVSDEEAEKLAKMKEELERVKANKPRGEGARRGQQKKIAKLQEEIAEQELKVNESRQESDEEEPETVKIGNRQYVLDDTMSDRKKEGLRRMARMAERLEQRQPSESTVPATPQGTGGATNVVTTDNSTLNNVVNNSTNSTIAPTPITDTNSSIMTNRMEF